MPCPRTQQASLPACSPRYLFCMLSAKQGSCEYHLLIVFWYDSTKGLNPRPTDCEEDAPHYAIALVYCCVGYRILNIKKIIFCLKQNDYILLKKINYLSAFVHSMYEIIGKLSFFSKLVKMMLKLLG